MSEQHRISELLDRPPRIINVGLDQVVEHLPGQGVEVVQVEWKPPAGGNLRMLKKLMTLSK